MVFDTHTTIKINSSKRDLAKAKGLKLQDVLDNALNIALGIDATDEIDATNYLIRMERLNKEITELNETKQLKETKINELHKEIEQIDIKLNNAKANLKLIEEKQEAEQKEQDYINSLFNPSKEQIEERKQKDYNELKVMYIKYNGDYTNNEDLKDEIHVFSVTYNISYEDLINKLHKDLSLHEKQ